MCAIMSRDQFESQLPRLVNGILNMYKKEKDVKHLPITQGFYNILSVATRDNSTVLEQHLPNILALLHQLVCSPSNLSNPMNLKNFNELLRCFEIIGTYRALFAPSRDSPLHQATCSLTRCSRSC